MADVFLSYVREDLAIAERISRCLQESGLSVWWDRHLRGGVDFGNEIDRQLSDAKSVIVLWSSASVASSWVRDEAGQARDEGKLVPVRIGGAQPPLGFRQVQSLDFEGWSGDVHSSAFSDLLASLREQVPAAADRSIETELVPESRAAVTPPTGSIRSRQSRWIAIGLGFVSVAVVAVIIVVKHGESIVTTSFGDGRVEISPVKLLTDDPEAARFSRSLPETTRRVFASAGLKTVAAPEDGERKTDDASANAEFALRQTIDIDGDDVILGADVSHQRDAMLLWSATLRNEAAAFREAEERFSVQLATVVRCGLGMQAFVQPGDRPSPDFLPRAFHWCAANANSAWPQAPELARLLAQSVPDSAIGYAAQAVSDATCASATFTCFSNSDVEAERVRKSVSENAKRAIDKNPNSAFPYMALAIVRDPDRSPAMREQLLLKGLTVDPGNYAARYVYGYLLGGVGRIREARSAFERAANDNPLDNGMTSESAYLRAVMGDVIGAREQFKAIARRFPNDASLKWWWPVAEAQPGGDPTMPEKFGVRYPAATHAETGCTQKLGDLMARHVPITEELVDGACPPDQVASTNFHAEWFYYGQGMMDAAFRALEAHADVYPLGSTELRQLFLPNFMPGLRADPRFMQFAQRIGLVDYWLETGNWPDFCTEQKLSYDCKEIASELRARSNAPNL